MGKQLNHQGATPAITHKLSALVHRIEVWTEFPVGKCHFYSECLTCHPRREHSKSTVSRETSSNEV